MRKVVQFFILGHSRNAALDLRSLLLENSEQRDIHHAARPANECYLRVHDYRQPFRLNFEAQVAGRVEPDATADPE